MKLYMYDYNAIQLRILRCGYNCWECFLLCLWVQRIWSGEFLFCTLIYHRYSTHLLLRIFYALFEQLLLMSQLFVGKIPQSLHTNTSLISGYSHRLWANVKRALAMLMIWYLNEIYLFYFVEYSTEHLLHFATCLQHTFTSYCCIGYISWISIEFCFYNIH